MNQSAERHIAKAKEYLAKGDAWYEKAAVEMRAAKDEGAIWKEIGLEVGHSGDWCRRIVQWAETPADERATAPFVEPGRDTTDIRGARRVLREAPMEQVESLISQLPAARQRQIGAAAAHEYMSRINRVADDTRRPVTEAVSGSFGSPSIVWEERALLKKLAEVKEYLDAHGDEMIPDPDGGKAESIRDLSLGAYAASKGRIDNAIAELGIGTSIEEGFSSLLSES